MKVIVTGGAGFIGSHVGDKLLEMGHQVVALDDLSGGFGRNVTRRMGLAVIDLLNAEGVSEYFHWFRPDLVVHAAAFPAEVLSHWMRGYNYSQNLVAWGNLVNACVRAEVGKIVALSSIAVYGAQEPPFTELMTLRPQDPYGIAKAAMEADLRCLGNTHGVNWVVVRPHNVMGPRQSMADPYRNVVAIFMRQAMGHFPITVYGDGQQKRAFSYVEDVASAIAHLAIGSFTGKTVNIGGDEHISVLDLAIKIKTLLGSESQIVHLPARHEVTDAWSDHQQLIRLMPEWSPTPFDWALEATAEWAKGVDIKAMRRYSYEITKGMPEVWR